MKKNKISVLLAVALVVSGGAAQAASSGGGGFDLSAMLAAVDFTTVIAAVLAIGALIAGKDIAIAGVKNVIRMIKGA